jgi:hypothetical protein
MLHSVQHDSDTRCLAQKIIDNVPAYNEYLVILTEGKNLNADYKA